jgi:hypothetical protein
MRVYAAVGFTLLGLLLVVLVRVCQLCRNALGHGHELTPH